MQGQNKKLRIKQNLLIALCITLYFFMMTSKQIFTAELVEVIDVFNITASQASLANLFYFVSYAIMQVLLMLFINKVNLRVYLSITMAFSALSTLLIGVVGNFGAGFEELLIIFIFNGLFQAGCYGGIVKLFVKYLDKDLYYRGVKLIQVSFLVSIIISYIMSSAFVAVARWDLPFIITGGVFVAFMLLFFIGVKKVTKDIALMRGVDFEKEKEEGGGTEYKITHTKQTKIYLFVLIGALCLIAVLGNSIYYALSNWFSILLYDVYAVPKEYSILVTLAVSTLVNLATVLMISILQKQKTMHILTSISLALSVIFGTILTFVYGNNFLLATAMCLAFMVCSRMGSSPYISVMAYNLHEVFDPSKYSLLANAFASVAAGVAPTVISLLFENFGWDVSFITMTVLAALLVVSVFVVKIYERKVFRSIYEKK